MDWFLHQIVAPIFVLGVLVFIHELGHFLVAKWCGVGVVKFSVGFGPAIFRFRRRETIYQLSIIPLGGFVRMVGDMPDIITGKQATDDEVREGGEHKTEEEEEEEELFPELAEVVADRNRWFIEKNFWQRSAIVAAGPIFNFVLAFFLAAAAAMLFGEERVDEAARIGEVRAGSPAELSGILAGDLITAVNQVQVDNWEGFAKNIHGSKGEEVLLSIDRGGSEVEIRVQPSKKLVPTVTGEKKEIYMVGVGRRMYRVSSGPIEALKFGALWTMDKTILTYWGLWGMVSGKVSADDLAGPLFILDTAGKQSQKGFDYLLYFTALLSVSLAVLNLLPIPVLDGGHLMFFMIEAVLGPISIRKKEFAQSIGMLLLIGLMAFAIRNDVTRDTSKYTGEISWDEEKKPDDKAVEQVKP